MSVAVLRDTIFRGKIMKTGLLPNPLHKLKIYFIVIVFFLRSLPQAPILSLFYIIM